MKREKQTFLFERYRFSDKDGNANYERRRNTKFLKTASLKYRATVGKIVAGIRNED